MSLRFGLIDGVEVDVVPAQVSTGEGSIDGHDLVVERLQARFGLPRADRHGEHKTGRTRFAKCAADKPGCRAGLDTVIDDDDLAADHIRHLRDARLTFTIDRDTHDWKTASICERHRDRDTVRKDRHEQRLVHRGHGVSKGSGELAPGIRAISEAGHDGAGGTTSADA